MVYKKIIHDILNIIILLTHTYVCVIIYINRNVSIEEREWYDWLQ